MNLKTFLLAAVAVAAGATGAAHAQTTDAWTPPRAGDWIVTGRLSLVAPTTEAGIFTAAGADSGLDVDVSDDVMPTLGFTYFFTDHIAVEAILGTTQHEVRARGGATDVVVHETWVLPPVVTVQWRPLTEGRFSPYVGAGVNAMIFYSGEDKNGFTVDLDDGVGGALQAGADIGLTGPWSLNVDVKKVWFSTDASINGGALVSDVDLDPWVVSIGVGRKF
ncbi:MAG: outer membrane beta-barrel protein [Alphaproteobacteria bacterium]|nr:outer membrane beta-barrel protein [Alphaproteobacteria bacterium]MBU1525183.1 outer membrane beta-barrel protein [Alphaproteobacteria bacterium]MBU2117323.1 outer membrane beta-barrel protein [Alphaproteobacteria bacterium]MBU2352179.1 outer membrane beta-barrel protein [Alphaproteobacteria bacterium]MBU2381189.1 outer membrane beta-barrel protein [Alphaproteobacteria bacterium]